MASKPSAIADALRRAHALLLNDLRRLEEAVRSNSGEDLTGIRARLSATRAHLAEHFRMEEQNGYMEVARQREPRLERTIDQLAAEHRHLRQGIDTLVQEAQEIPNLDETLRANVRQWVERVRQHEVRENELVQDAFNLDIGTED